MPDADDWITPADAADDWATPRDAALLDPAAPLPDIERAPETPMEVMRPPAAPARTDTIQYRDAGGRGLGAVRLPVPAWAEAQQPPEMPDPQDFTRPRPADYESLSTGQRAGQQLRSGVETLRQGLTSMGLGGLYDEIGALNRMDRGESAPEVNDPRRPVPIGAMTPDQRAAYRASLEEAAGRRLASIVGSQNRQALLASNPRARALVEQLNAGNWREGWRTFTSDPAGIIQQFSVESAPLSAPMMAAGITGGLLGGPAVGAVASGLGSYGTEFGPRQVEALMEALRERGVDTSDERAVQDFLRTDPRLAVEAAQGAARGALGPAAFDAATMGGARGIRPGAGALRNAGRVARNTGLELLSEPAGEATGQLLQDGQVKPGELAAELLGAGPQVASTTAYGTLMEARTPQAPEQPAPLIAPGPQQPAAPAPGGLAAVTVPPAAAPNPAQAALDATLAVAAPGAQTSITIDGQTASGTAPPAATPPAPAPGDTTGLASMGSGIAGAIGANLRDALWQGYSAGAGAMRNDPIVRAARFIHAQRGRPMDQAEFLAFGEAWARADATARNDVIRQFIVAGQSPETPPGVVPAPAGQPSPPVAPQQPPGGPPAPAAAGVQGAAAPIPAPAPPPANPLPQSLAAALAAPSDAQLAQKAQQRAEAVATLQAQLPTGWRVVDEDGSISVLDPTGDWTHQHESLPRDVGSMLAEVRQADEAGRRSGIYPNAVDAAAAQTNPSPTPGQAQAGNYAQGPVALHGIRMRIETPRGATRSGVGKDGQPWSVQMPAHYGRIEGTTGADGDQVDVYLGPQAEDANAPVFVIDQVDADTGAFDEHKVMLGYPTPAAALAAYDAAFNDGRGPDRRAAVTPMTLAELKAWLAGDTSKPMQAERIAEGVQRRKDAEQAKADAEKAKAKGEKDAEKEFQALEQRRDEYRALIEAAEKEGLLKGTQADQARRNFRRLYEGGGPTAEQLQQARENIARLRQQAEQQDKARKEAGSTNHASASPSETGKSDQPAGGAGPQKVNARQAWVELSDEDRELLLARLERILERKGALTWADLPADIQNQLSTSAAYIVKKAFEQDAKGAVAALAVPPTNSQQHSPAGSEEGSGNGEAPAKLLVALARRFFEHFAAGKQFASIAQARTFAASFLGRAVQPGTMDAKLVDEAVELGIVMVARSTVAGLRHEGPAAIYDRLVDLYRRQPRVGTRTSDSIERQAYSTPAPLAWVASTLAGITPESVVLEPTAGNGMLLIGADPQRAVVNEIDDDRRTALDAQGFQATGADAASSKAPFVGIAVDAVIANPPFGPVRGDDGKSRRFDMGFIQDGYATGEIDHAIALRALEGMKADGTAVLILGGIAKTVTDAEKRGDAYNNSKAKREFFYTLYQKYGVVDHFTVAGELYAKQGAAWPVDVIVIRGRGKSDLLLPSQRAPRVYASWDALKEVLDGRAGLAAAAAPAGQAAGVGAAGEQPGDGGGAGDTGRPGGRPEPAGVAAPADAAGGVADGEGAGSASGGAPADGRPRDTRAVEPGNAPGGRPAGAGGAAAAGQPGVAGLPESGGGATGGAAVPGAAGPDGAAGGAGDAAGGVDGAGVPASGRSDVAGAFDSALDDVFGKDEAPAAPPASTGSDVSGAFDDALADVFGSDEEVSPAAEEAAWPETPEAARKMIVRAAATNDAPALDSLLQDIQDAIIIEPEWLTVRNLARGALEMLRQRERGAPKIPGTPPPRPPKAAPPTKPPGERKPPRAPPEKKPPRTPGDAGKSAIKNTISGADQAMAGLTQLFGGGKLNSGLGWSEETWNAAKPLFVAAVQKFRQAASDIGQMMRLLLTELRDAYQWTREMVTQARPYIERFISDVSAGRIKLDPEKKKRQTDQETDRQVAYEPRSDAPGVGTLVPVNMRTAVSRSLAIAEDRAGKPLTEFVAERLGYTPDETRRFFSAEQVDAIALGIHNLDDEAGFVIGDQTGVGKGRFVAAMIRYALRQNLIPVFVTEKPNLYRDMARDLTDIGMKGVLDQILPTNAGLNLPLTDDAEGARLKTPDAKAQNQRLEDMSTNQLVDEQKIVFTSYSQMQQIAEADTARIKFMRRIAPRAFIILDESHNAGGAAKDDSSKQGKADRGSLFRSFLREAKSAVYSSATWAKRPDVMDLYGIKTDMRLAVTDIGQLAEAISRGGVPMQQIVSAMMAESGQYIRRERSFAGVTYDLEPVPVNRETYEKVARALAGIFKVSLAVRAYAKGLDKEAKADAKRISVDNTTGGAGVESTSFGAVMHNLINQMLLASKTPGTVKLALARLEAGEKPVIALANTMGSFIEEFAAENEANPGDRLALDFNALLMRYLRKTLVLRARKPFMKKGEKAETITITPEQLGREGEAAYRAMEKLIEGMDLGEFPVSPIDYIRSKLGAAGYQVGEITGRTEAADYRADGGVYYRRRPAKETTPAGRLDAIRRFNGGSADKPVPEAERLDVMILNQSGATGLSLHANATFGDQRKRVMLIAQAEANIDTHMQMLGRVHRTGQVVTPAYLQLVADVPAEKRPAAVLAKKMASLSAATTSNRRGGMGSEDTPDFLNEYGDAVVYEIVANDAELHRRLGEPELETEAGGTDDVARRVSGRIPLLPLAEQEALYARIETAYKRAVELADEAGTNALEAKTLELDARLIEEHPWTEGKGERLFAGPSKIGKYDVKRLRNPPALYTIVGRVGASVGEKLDNEAIKDKAPAELGEILSGLASDQGEDWRESQIAGVDADAGRLRKVVDDRDGLGDKERAKALERIDDQRARIQAVLRQAKPGGFVDVTTLGEDGGKLGTAIVLDISPPTQGNPIAPGSWEMTLLFDDGTRHTTSLAGVFGPDNQPQSGDEQTRKAGGLVVEANEDGTDTHTGFLERVQAASRDTREERWIVTGNLLAGFAKRSGQIANFYDDADQMRQGIILPAKFDLDEFEADQLPQFSSEDATAFLRDPAVSDPLIMTADEALQVARDSGGDYVISGPASKKGGADLFLDRALRDAIGAEFVQKGDRMRAAVPAGRLATVMEQFSRIATSRRQDIVSKTPAAKDWKRPAAAPSPTRDSMLYSGFPLFDPDAWKRFIITPAGEALGKAAAAVKAEHLGVVKRLWQRPPLPPGVTVDDSGRAPKGLTPGFSRFRLPTRMFRQWPALAALVDQGIRAEERMSVWSTRMGGRLDTILGGLKKAGGDQAKVMDALLAADADSVDIEDAAVAAQHFTDAGLNDAEAQAAGEINRLLVQAARLVDQHRRAMLPRVRERKARVWTKMTAIMESASVKGDDYAKAYRRRAYLNGRIRDGKGDVVAQAAEVAAINTRLRAMRAADPEIQARLAELQDEYDALEARLAATSVRTRKGYFPHKFFGNWRLFQMGEADPDTGEREKTEITSDQGFYDTLGQAIAAARTAREADPSAQLRIEPRMVVFPGSAGSGGAVLSDQAYFRLRRGIEEAAGLEGDALNDALKGVAKRRSRRRMFTPGLFRKGAEGFSKDMERVLRTHVAQTTRYVEMDKLKFRYVETTERMGLSPGRAKAVEKEGLAEVQRTLESWWSDVNGNKQAGETQVDAAIERLGLPGATLAAFSLGAAAGGIASSPFLGVALGGYMGYRMARAVAKGGDFPTRTFMGDISSDLAHLKLGMLLNLASATVNLTQTLVNTWPVLGEKWTAIGIKRATAALWSQVRNAGNPGRMSTDAILLTRADIATRFSLASDAPPLLVESRGITDRLRAVSMMPFHSVEVFNRAVAFLGAYARAEAGGATPAAAMEQGRQVLRRTQFHQGQAARPEVLRNTLLRLPTQFKNFLAQQVGFALGLEGKGQVLRFLVGIFLVAGLLGLPGMQLFDWLAKLLIGESPITWIKDRIITAGALGQTAGTALDVLARGMPALLGMDISGRVGMGAGFLPDSGSDLSGPAVGTVAQLREIAKQGGELVDYLFALSPAAQPLRALEAAANGASITSARFWTGGVFGDGESRLTNSRKRGQTEYQPTNQELVTMGAGFRPLRQALLADAREVQATEEAKRREKQNGYLARIIGAHFDGRPEQIGEISAEARRAGIGLTPKQIREALRDAIQDRSQRDIQRAPRATRPAVIERNRAIEGRFQ